MKTAFVLAALVVGAVAQNSDDVLKSTYKGSAGLNDAAAASGKYMGTATDLVYSATVQGDPYYVAELKNKKDWSIVTPGNVMKPESLQPQKGVFSYQKADNAIDILKKAGMRIRCHTFVWHNQVPGWLSNGQWTNATLLAALEDHITNVMTHFGDNCYSWDVVNEVLDDNGGYRDSFWYQVTGPAYIAHAFKVADRIRKQLGLKVKLYYNDYSIEWEGGAKTKFAQQMVKGLVDQKVGIDGVGLQSHFQIGATPSKSSLMNIMKAYTSMGLDVAVTELDVRTKPLPPSLDTQKQQSVDYASVIGACKETEGCVGVTIWDFIDGYSWVPGTFPGEGFALPFYQPNGKGTKLVRKACFDGIINAWGIPPSNGSSSGEVTDPPTEPPANGADLWQQCDGINYTGPKGCKEGTCIKFNDYYYQCQ